MALSLGGDMIVSTDYPNNRDTGEAHISMPHSRWGHTWAGWLDSYAGVPLPMGGAGMGQCEYSGKPSGTLHVPAGAWKMVDADVPDPSVSALEFQNLYAHCDCRWANPGVCGWIRVKYVRENGDATAYQEYTVSPGREDFLITALHFEKGQRGQGGRWHVQCGGGLSAIDVTTRYVKLATAT
jgi:hypothetical protein